ncbi:MAG: aspartate carbamoyltransferase [Cyanobium sp. MAG06]|nr:aspartate carbamoyltransferase [Cyanobium sp. MAG06]
MKNEINLKEISPYNHICISQQFDKDFIKEIFTLADYMKDNINDVSHILENKIACLLFYEPSTRTRFSFESAIHRLGGRCITTENAAQFSSAIKGETLSDTIEMVNNYADIVIIRHSSDEICYEIISKTKIPFINAGTGKTQHPTQALLDIYTIYKEKGRLDNLNICICGDLLRGRTCDSLVYLLSKYENNKFYFVSPDNSKIKDKLKDYLRDNNIQYIETNNMNSVLPLVDVFYMTRVQKERFDNEEEYLKAKGQYILNKDNIEMMPADSIIMHPLPRVDEIDVSIDNDPRAKYFQQAGNGLYIRMALLKMLVKGR